MCHPEPTADLSSYKFHPRATVLHRLNLQVLPGWNKSKDGDEETTFSIVLVTLVPLSPGRMSLPLLCRQTQDTWRLLQASVLCLSICRPGFTSLFSIWYFIHFYEGLLVTSSTEGVTLWYSHCRKRSEWTVLRSNTVLKVTTSASVKCFLALSAFFCLCSFMGDFKTVSPTIKLSQCLISSSIFLDAVAKIPGLIQLANYYREGVFMAVPARTTKLAVASSQPGEEIKWGREIIWNKM